MRIRRLQSRARPFRYAGFWLTAAAWLMLAAGERGGGGALQIAIGCLFCLSWPVLMDAALRRLPPPGERARAEWLSYVAECAVVALVLAWCSLPPLPALTTALWLLGGATALAGWPLAAAGLAAGLPAAWLGHLAAPAVTPASTPAADLLALAMLAVFVLALGLQSFRQAQRLDAQRLMLAQRSAELERVNQRLQRYLPPSLSARVRRAPEELARWERCWLTVIFIDLAGFTRLAERLDAESLAALVDDYFGALIPAVERRQGEVSKLFGDGLLAVFGARGGGDDDRRRWAGEAVALCREAPGIVAAVASRWRERGERVELAMRAGVASGLCTLGDRGGSGRLDFTLIGTPVNLASRLQARAAVNGILVDEATALLCGRSGALCGPVELDVQGLGRVAAFAVEAC